MATSQHKLYLPTTMDNPFDPFTQWQRWWDYDHNMGYCTYEHLADIMCPSNELTDAEYTEAFEQACNTLVTWYHPHEVYRLVTQDMCTPF